LKLAAGGRRLDIAVATAELDEAPGIDRANAPETADAAPRGAVPPRPHSSSRG
jgi:hypothetical protein